MSLKESAKNFKSQSECKLLKSNYDNLNNKSVKEDENKLYFYTGISNVAIFDLVFDFAEKSINQSDVRKLKKRNIYYDFNEPWTRITWEIPWI